jgi:hypothetical protein
MQRRCSGCGGGIAAAWTGRRRVAALAAALVPVWCSWPLPLSLSAVAGAERLRSCSTSPSPLLALLPSAVLRLLFVGLLAGVPGVPYVGFTEEPPHCGDRGKDLAGSLDHSAFTMTTRRFSAEYGFDYDDT